MRKSPARLRSARASAKCHDRKRDTPEQRNVAATRCYSSNTKHKQSRHNIDYKMADQDRAESRSPEGQLQHEDSNVHQNETGTVTIPQIEGPAFRKYRGSPHDYWGENGDLCEVFLDQALHQLSLDTVVIAGWAGKLSPLMKAVAETNKSNGIVETREFNQDGSPKIEWPLCCAEIWPHDNVNSYLHRVITWEDGEVVTQRRIIAYGNCEGCYRMYPLGVACKECKGAPRAKKLYFRVDVPEREPHKTRQAGVEERCARPESLHSLALQYHLLLEGHFVPMIDGHEMTKGYDPENAALVKRDINVDDLISDLNLHQPTGNYCSGLFDHLLEATRLPEVLIHEALFKLLDDEGPRTDFEDYYRGFMEERLQLHDTEPNLWLTELSQVNHSELDYSGHIPVEEVYDLAGHGNSDIDDDEVMEELGGQDEDSDEAW